MYINMVSSRSFTWLGFFDGTVGNQKRSRAAFNSRSWVLISWKTWLFSLTNPKFYSTRPHDPLETLWFFFYFLQKSHSCSRKSNSHLLPLDKQYILKAIIVTILTRSLYYSLVKTKTEERLGLPWTGQTGQLSNFYISWNLICDQLLQKLKYNFPETYVEHITRTYKSIIYVL